jgi:hypothetical protein
MEHRTADTLTRLNQAERQLKEQRQAAYEVRAARPACARFKALTLALLCRTL